MNEIERVVDYLRQQRLLLTTAESCTAGAMVTLLAQVPGSGEWVDSGYVVYSAEAKQRLLDVRPQTIATFNLTSCEVAREMALGALHDSPATVAVATTGLLGPDDVDGIPAGTVCFAWAFALGGQVALFTRRERFFGPRESVQQQAALHGLRQVVRFHRAALKGERA
ncbi:CinA family protein [Pseudomonas chlororaphis]|uniref:CinA family protein n=1 Tax=Pseudomonas chlororaphis TaxID=587753 RepID=UPI001E31F767|nr:CinA family protein [Pseudomonas chlororaphis]MCB2255027.1 CinA family protein [Pseudomonas chlororaphis]